MCTTGVGITFLSGTRTVGGVQILVSTGDGAVLFDLGVVGNPDIVREAALFHELVPPRYGHTLRDYLRAGMAPHIDGIYHPAQEPGTVAAATATIRRSPLHAGRPLIDLRDTERAVFVSHLHDDHMALIPFLAPDIPLLMSDRSAQLHGALVRAGAVPPAATPPIGFQPGEGPIVGGLSLQIQPVDHDVPGSSGLLIRTSDARIAYTGDWRLHGSHPDLMHRFAEECRGVDVLITEASTTGHTPRALAAQVPEEDVASWFYDVVKRTRGTAYVSLAERNLERHAAIREAAEDLGRRMLLSNPTARLWSVAGVRALAPGDAAVWAEDDRGSRPQGFEPAGVAEVTADPGSWVAELPAPLWPLLLDIGAGPADTFVHLNGHPYGPNDPRWPVLRTWVRSLGMQWEAVSAHGHALPQHLVELVEAIAPKLVVPVHSNAPERFPSVSAPVRTVVAGQRMDVDPSRQAARSSR